MALTAERPPRTVAEAAEDMNIAQVTVRAWIAQGRLGYIKLGRSVRVPASEIERLLREGYVAAAEAVSA
jgi:excisionase family DNA binding protein